MPQSDFGSNNLPLKIIHPIHEHTSDSFQGSENGVRDNTWKLYRRLEALVVYQMCRRLHIEIA
jgi:hypothetical protein